MNDTNPDSDDNLADWARKFPPPVLRDAARQSSLAAALAAATAHNQVAAKFKFRAVRSWMACAACWALSGWLWWITPSAPAPGTGQGFAEWQGPDTAGPPDKETERMLAQFYTPSPVQQLPQRSTP